MTKILGQIDKRGIRRMERARDLLMRIRQEIGTGIATAEKVALLSSVLCTVALLEHEIGRHLMAWNEPDDESDV